MIMFGHSEVARAAHGRAQRAAGDHGATRPVSPSDSVDFGRPTRAHAHLGSPFSRRPIDGGLGVVPSRIQSPDGPRPGDGRIFERAASLII